MATVAHTTSPLTSAWRSTRHSSAASHQCCWTGSMRAGTAASLSNPSVHLPRKRGSRNTAAKFASVAPESGGNPVDEIPEILNGRWENEDSPNGRRGRKAPRCSKLKIFGAFLSTRYDEFIPARKRYRAVDIHKCGWS